MKAKNKTKKVAFGFLLTVAVIPFNLQAQFYVATNGSDSNPGTLAQPFATLVKAQSAMRGSSTKTTYIRAGTYHLKAAYTDGTIFTVSTYGLYLTASDNNETWSYYPPDGYNSAILDGGSSSPTTGLSVIVAITNSSGVTWNGIQAENFVWNAIWIPASPNTTISNCIIHDGYFNENGDGPNPSNGGAIFARNSPGLMVSHNVVYNIAYKGIQAITSSSGNMNNTTFQYNVILNTMIGIQNGAPITDGGPIYFQNKNFSSSSTGLVCKNNFIRDDASSMSRGIYFDDGASNASATGNVVALQTKEFASQVHGGSNIVYSGNIIDLGSSGQEAILYNQGDGNGNLMTGNTFTNNIVIAGSSGGGQGYADGGGAGHPLIIKDNAYYNYVGSSVNSTGDAATGSDANPVYENPPFCGGWTYNIVPGGPVYNSPVSFPQQPANWGQPGFWGPPGFVIPKPGTPPSYPTIACGPSQSSASCTSIPAAASQITDKSGNVWTLSNGHAYENGVSTAGCVLELLFYNDTLYQKSSCTSPTVWWKWTGVGSNNSPQNWVAVSGTPQAVEACNTTGISNTTENSDAEVYPNPFTGNATLT